MHSSNTRECRSRARAKDTRLDREVAIKVLDLDELGVGTRSWAFGLDGERFVVTKRLPSSETRIVLVQDWQGPDSER